VNIRHGLKTPVPTRRFPPPWSVGFAQHATTMFFPHFVGDAGSREPHKLGGAGHRDGRNGVPFILCPITATALFVQ